jgi:hypothetical protein
MAGLLGFMAAGATKGFAQSRLNSIAQQEEFDMRRALLEAQTEKELMLKKAGYEMEAKQDSDKMARRASYFDDVEETSKTPESTLNRYTDEQGNEVATKVGGETVTKKRAATAQDAAERAMKSGDFEAGEGLLKMSAKKEKAYDSIKLDDGSIFSFDKSTGTGKVILEGGGKLDIPKNEYELAYQATGGDPVKMGEYLVSQKARIAAAGRAPERASDGDLAYSDWKRKPENKGKGRDDFEKAKAGWGKSNDSDMVEVTEKDTHDVMGKPMTERTVKKKVPASAIEKSKKLSDPFGIRKQ